MASSTAAAPSIVAQPSLFGLDEPSIDARFCGLERHVLDRGAWVDVQRGWLRGHQTLFDRLIGNVEWEQHTRPMYERMVEVPRLTGGRPSGPGFEVLDVAAEALAARYGAAFERIGVALYRTGRDSVAWHGDQIARERHQALVATVSVGEPRKFCLRPKNGGPSRSMHLGHGDLVVMGGTCQRTWDHAVPKVAQAGPRIAVMFRPIW
ncbi:MAG: alpha-ketoglutarate-dependent dioxygenase AlkB [Actinomycetota bacterium]